MQRSEMHYAIKNPALLRRLLWVDTFLGGTTAILGLCFFNPLTSLLGLTANFILSVSIITLGYAVMAGVLANQNTISVALLRALILANWLWTFISVVLLLVHFNQTQPLGKIFLGLQIIAVGGLAYFEGKQLVVTTDKFK